MTGGWWTCPEERSSAKCAKCAHVRTRLRARRARAGGSGGARRRARGVQAFFNYVRTDPDLAKLRNAWAVMCTGSGAQTLKGVP